MSNPSNLSSKLDPVIAVNQNIKEVSTTQQAPLGTRIRVGERTFHYAQASASVSGGTVVCSLGPVASHQSGILAIAAASVDQTVLSGTSSASVAANYYAEGYFGVATGTNIGEMYRIKSNAAGSTGFAITLYDGLVTAITSGTGFYLTPNPFTNVFVGSQALDMAIGVAPVNVTSGGYAWFQTWGPCGVKHVAATPANGVLVLGTTGGVAVTADATTGGGLSAVALPIGKNSRLAATAGQANPVFLTILP